MINHDEAKKKIALYRKRMPNWDVVPVRIRMAMVGNPFEHIFNPFDTVELDRWEKLTREGKTLREEDPIRVEVVPFYNSLTALCLIAKYCGCAVVVDKNAMTYTAIARESTIAWFKRCLAEYSLKHQNVLRRRQRSSVEDVDAMGELAVARSVYTRLWSAIGVDGMHSFWSALFMEGEDNRLQLNRVQHKVCELFPTLRVRKSQYDVEVELRRYDDNLFLSGAVWSLEYYTSGQLDVDIKAWLEK